MMSTLSGSDLVALEAETLGSTVSALAMSPDGRRCYLGAGNSGPLREQLGVVDIGEDGKPVGLPRWHRITEEALTIGDNSVVRQILPHPSGLKLYLIFAHSKVKAQKQLVVFDLVDGEPSGAPRTYPSGLFGGGVTALALHPDRGVGILYGVARSQRGVGMYKLNNDLEPDTPVQIATFGSSSGSDDVAVSANGKKLYTGTVSSTSSPDAQPVLQVVDLGADGKPVTGASVQTVPMGPSPEPAQRLLRFLATPNAVYRRTHFEAANTFEQWPLVSVALDASGGPVGSVRQHSELAGQSFVLTSAGDQILALREASTVDAFTGGASVPNSVVIQSASLGQDGVPGAPVEIARLGRRTAVGGGTGGVGKLAIAAGRATAITRVRPGNKEGFLVNEVRGWHIRVTPKDARTMAGKELEKVRCLLMPTNPPGDFGVLAIGQPSAWLPLDDYLKNKPGRAMLNIEALPLPPDQHSAVGAAEFDIDIADGHPDAGGTILRLMNDSVEGNKLWFLLPTYDVRRASDRLDTIQLLSDYARGFVEPAQAVAVPADRLPKKFPISCFAIVGGQGHREQLDACVRTVRALGINTAVVQSWGELPAADIAAILAKHGLTRRSGAAAGNRADPARLPISLPGIFAFDVEMTDANIEAWAAKRVQEIISANGATPDQIIDYKIMDEPGWYFPQMLNQVRANEDAGTAAIYLEAFRQYLRDKGLAPADVGADDWSTVIPIGRGAVGPDDTSRRLFIESARFFVDSATEGTAKLRNALRAALGHDRATISLNTNNKPNIVHRPHPNVPLPNNPDNPNASDPIIGPDLAFAGYDWLHAGRHSAYTVMSMDNTLDHDTQSVSFLGDLLRSASARGTAGWTAYIKANQLGRLPFGPKYRLLSLAGHGASLIDLFSFGPSAFSGDGWSDLTQEYGPIARAVEMLGAAEGHIVGAKPAQATVALLSPSSSLFWDADGAADLYLSEVEHLHTALVHRGYAVDIVDQHDLEHGALASYRALYLTGPNLSVAAQRNVAAWVVAGGVLAVTPGAATADELNRPTNLLNDVLGLNSRTGERFAALGIVQANEVEFGKNLALTDPGVQPEQPGFVDGAPPIMAVRDPITVLDVDQSRADVVGVYRTGGRFAVSQRRHGKGVAIAYGFFPGAHYRNSADRAITVRLPKAYGATQREAVVAPARIAGGARPVKVSVPGVEACRLDRKPGGAQSAIVLLNWTAVPQSSITLTVSNTTATKARSIELGPLAAQANPVLRQLEVTLPVTDVDIVLLD